MKYLIATLGCKVNQFETQAMEERLQRDGHVPVIPGETADAVIINTCAVTAESGRKSRQMIRRLQDENPGAVVAVCGCYAQLSPEENAEIGAKVIFGSGDRMAFVEAVERAVETGEAARRIDRPFSRKQIELLPAGAVSGRTRAMLKIQDGCRNFCTYCIIPYVRGSLRSMPIADAVAETRRLRDEGFRELVLTGIEVASYGLDLPDHPTLTDLVEAVAAEAGGMRLRLGSLEPTVITEDFCRRLAATGKLCRHFHLSLQSGCDRTLKAMNRKYDTAFFYRTAELLREYFPGCALTGDLIAGFPGETEEDHLETLDFIRRCAFAELHVFPYSRRPGTPADKLPDQLTQAVKSRRAHEAKAVSEETGKAFLEASVGRTLPVLFESPEGEGSIGHSDTYLYVRVPETGLRGQMREVRISGVEDGVLTGALAD
ncbi:MAG: tRNA (N(6)-L-threonylcarbamoyladenosine(37)-C(2))-methylthiotransferase MtaB [Oscillospiraceae bacterium]|nr:tRNA (N(6)-L-threonylcarbamoyladenosine(37)-C(2))-methylthiotransferase MtaB [Oscillospiraceae bacterium]